MGQELGIYVKLYINLIRGQGPGLVTSLVFFPCFIMQKILFSARSLLFETRPTPSPVRKWQTDLPETRKCAVSPTKIFTNSLFGLCMHWIGSGSKQHKKRRGKLVLMGPSDAAAKVNRSLSAAEGYVAKYAAKEDTKRSNACINQREN